MILMAGNPPRIDVILFDGFDEMDVVGPLEALYIAAEIGVPVTVATVTLDHQEHVTGSHGTKLVPDGVYRRGADMLVFPGGRSGPGSAIAREISSGGWFPHLEQAAQDGTTMVSVCTGALVLAAAGIIGTRRAATHRAAHATLAENGATVVDERVVDDGDLISSGGITSGIDLGLWLVERIAGQANADRVAEIMEYKRFRPAA
jgi:transcriptional regulator GlxA family with amidase domain